MQSTLISNRGYEVLLPFISDSAYVYLHYHVARRMRYAPGSREVAKRIYARYKLYQLLVEGQADGM